MGSSPGSCCVDGRSPIVVGFQFPHVTVKGRVLIQVSFLQITLFQLYIL